MGGQTKHFIVSADYLVNEWRSSDDGYHEALECAVYHFRHHGSHKNLARRLADALRKKEFTPKTVRCMKLLITFLNEKLRDAPTPPAPPAAGANKD